MVRKIVYSAFIVFGLAIVILVISFLQDVEPAQKSHIKHLSKITPNYEALLDTLNYQTLKREYGNNKILPKGYEMAALIALSHYPELKDVHILFELNEESAPMEATFQYETIFGIGKRKYCIRLNVGNNTGYDEILMYSLPFDAQVGILAHELGHIVYYRDLNLFGIIKWGLKYLFSENFRATHERTTDLMPIDHGLGWQILDYARYIRYDESTRDLYEKYGHLFIDKYYLTDSEIEDYMSQLEGY